MEMTVNYLKDDNNIFSNKDKKNILIYKKEIKTMKSNLIIINNNAQRRRTFIYRMWR